MKKKVVAMLLTLTMAAVSYTHLPWRMRRLWKKLKIIRIRISPGLMDLTRQSRCAKLRNRISLLWEICR